MKYRPQATQALLGGVMIGTKIPKKTPPNSPRRINVVMFALFCHFHMTSQPYDEQIRMNTLSPTHGLSRWLVGAL